MHENNMRIAEATSIVDVEFVARGGCRGMVAGSTQVPAVVGQGAADGGRRGGRIPDVALADEAGPSRARGEGGRRNRGGSSSDGD